ATVDTVTDISCTGAADGRVDATVSGYWWTNVGLEVFTNITNITTGHNGTITGAIGGPESLTINGLSPGEFYILFTEEDGCVVASESFIIEQSPRLLEITANSPVNDNCNPNAGVIVASAQFGTAPYVFQYLLTPVTPPTATDPGWTTATTMNVEHGNYIVYVMDANHCIQGTPVTVLEDPSPEISLSIIDECVEENLFQVEITLDNAAEAMNPFQISVNDQAFQNFVFDASNSYVV